MQQVIQVEWQSLAVFGSALGAAIVAAAKLLANQWATNCAADTKRHDESRADAREARDENRHLSQSILVIQGETVKTLSALQREIERVVARLDRLEGAGSKPHPPTP